MACAESSNPRGDQQPAERQRQRESVRQRARRAVVSARGGCPATRCSLHPGKYIRTPHASHRSMAPVLFITWRRCIGMAVSQLPHDMPLIAKTASTRFLPPRMRSYFERRAAGTSSAAFARFAFARPRVLAVDRHALRRDFGSGGFLLRLDPGEFVVLSREHAAQFLEPAVDRQQVALLSGDDLPGLLHLRDGRRGLLHGLHGIHLRLVPLDQLLVLGELVAQPRLLLLFGGDGRGRARDRVEHALLSLIEFADPRLERGQPFFEPVYDHVISLQRQQRF